MVRASFNGILNGSFTVSIGFRVRGPTFGGLLRVWGLGSGLGSSLRSNGLGFRVKGLGFRFV